MFDITSLYFFLRVRACVCVFVDLQGSTDTKQRAERMVELQERRRSLQALLGTRLAELRRVCLQEAVSVLHTQTRAHTHMIT